MQADSSPLVADENLSFPEMNRRTPKSATGETRHICVKNEKIGRITVRIKHCAMLVVFETGLCAEHARPCGEKKSLKYPALVSFHNLVSTSSNTARNYETEFSSETATVTSTQCPIRCMTHLKVVQRNQTLAAWWNFRGLTIQVCIGSTRCTERTLEPRQDASSGGLPPLHHVTAGNDGVGICTEYPASLHWMLHQAQLQVGGTWKW